MPEEMNKIISAISNKEIIERGSRIYYKGILSGQEVVAVFSRWGKVAAATTATHLILEFKVDRIVFTGVAGGISPDLNIGDIVIGQHLYQHDMDARPLMRRFEIPLTGLDTMEFKTFVFYFLAAVLVFASLRVVTERTKMAMPETAIGLFPDVGGGYFLSRCPGRVGEWLALTGDTIGAGDAVAFGLADGCLPVEQQAMVWENLGSGHFADGAAVKDSVASKLIAVSASASSARGTIDQYFSLTSVREIVGQLEAADTDWARATAATLRKRSPLMLHVVLEQVRRARAMDLADDLRMERDLVRHCFFLRAGQSETVEGIRALAVDKDHAPKWNPARIEDVTPEMVAPFFVSPWPAHAHPLAHLC